MRSEISRNKISLSTHSTQLIRMDQPRSREWMDKAKEIKVYSQPVPYILCVESIGRISNVDLASFCFGRGSEGTRTAAVVVLIHNAASFVFSLLSIRYQPHTHACKSTV